MKCAYCGKEMKNESEMIMISNDADFVCNKNCEKEYKKERDIFYKNIVNDKWYDNWMNTRHEKFHKTEN